MKEAAELPQAEVQQQRPEKYTGKSWNKSIKMVRTEKRIIRYNTKSCKSYQSS